MFDLPFDDDSMEADTKEMRMKPLRNLGESIQTLLGSKAGLTFTWADAVCLMIEDLSSRSSSSSCASAGNNDAEVSEAEKLQLEEVIAKLEGELNALRTYLAVYDGKRREALNKLLDLKGSIRVFCRVRPFLEDEKTGPRSVSVAVPRSDTIVINTGRGKGREYHFNKIFLPEASQDDVFAEVEPILRSALDGHNVCIFAYGQTGSGKTFTMEGTADSPGVVPHAVKEIFRQASDLKSSVAFTFTFSMLEVYMGCLRDLLAHGPGERVTDPDYHKCLSIQMDANGGVEVENLREVAVTGFSQTNRWYRIGSRARSTAWTNSNESSSRSHCLIRISIRSSSGELRKVSTSKLWMVDLGGSERLIKTKASGQTMEEGKAINLSLSALGDVIRALKEKQPHVPYRNSKLTQILGDSLGNNSKTLMLVHISPREDDLGETLCSLNFAKRAQGIHLGKELSAEEKKRRETVMAELMQHMKDVEDECQSARSSIQTVEFLLREKKKALARNDSFSESVLVNSEKDSITETEIVCELGIGSTGRSVGLPRFMNPTASSRLRGRSDSNCSSPGTGRKRVEAQDHYNGRPKSLRTGATKTSSSKQSSIEQSQCDLEWNKSNRRLESRAARFVSKQPTIDESQCIPQMLRNSSFGRSSMASDRRESTVNNNNMKQLSTPQDGPRHLSGCNAPRKSHRMSRFPAPNNRKAPGSSYSKKSTPSDELKCIPEMDHGGMRPPSLPNNKRVSGSYNSKLFTTSDESQSTISDSNYQKGLENAVHNSTPIPSIEYKRREATDKPEARKKTPSPGDFQSRTTFQNKRRFTHQCRNSFDRKL